MEAIKLKDLKIGDWFTKKPIMYPKKRDVFIRDVYDRTTKKYVVLRWNDVNDSMVLKGDTLVYTDFIF